MFSKFVVSASLAAALSLTATAVLADGEKAKVFKDSERHRVETYRASRVSRASSQRYYRTSRVHHRHGYRRHHAYRAWDGRYGMYPRQHFFVSGVHAHGYYGSPVNYATVRYQTYVYYTPTYPSLSNGYPPYAHLYDLTPGPIYNKPCLC